MDKEGQMGRVKWSHAAIALALIAALAIAAPAIGGSSLKKLVKKEVSKQIAKATGPPGTNGTNGLDGTARAYGLVAKNGTLTVSKGVVSVGHPFGGIYCVTLASGIDPATTAPVAILNGQTDDLGAAAPTGVYVPTVEVSKPTGSCPSTTVQVRTSRFYANGSTGLVTANADEGFFFVVP
jgi:hypothetical protein